MSSPSSRPAAVANPVAALRQYGQSVWLDFIRRSLIASGELKRLVEDDALGGVTSNPAIFEKAIDGSNDYATAIEAITHDEPGLPAKEVYELLAIKDIQDATDVLRPVYEKTSTRDGYVSLEVSPDLANDTDGTIKEARHLWKAVARPNVMIKVPATPAGLPAIRTLIGEGVNVNVTLLFAREAYEAVADAFIEGLEARARKGEPLGQVASVASFFVSRIDTLVDSLIAEKLKTATGADKARLEGLMGKVAIANAKLAYQSYKKIFAGPRWAALAAKNAQTQRVLWASTGTKNPRYRDVLYVEELIGPETVDTVPPETLSAFRDHGRPRASLEENVTEAMDTLDDLEKAGISLKKATDDLLADGVKKFVEPFAKLLKAVERRCREANKARINGQSHALPSALASEVAAKLKEWDAQGGTHRLWAGDASLWTGSDEASWIGWIGIVEHQLDDLTPLLNLQAEAKKEGFKYALLLGMGGSSLCPEVWKETFGVLPGSLELHVLDSTDPAQVRAFEEKVDLRKTLFIVSSKSGSTLEPNIFKAYFFDRVKQALGADQAGSRFIAVTDPGSNLEKEAKADRFRHIFPGVKTIGGRYSALSNFGMVPAAAMGLDVERLLDEAERMLHACAPGVPAEENPGLVLGAILGLAANRGHDKLTLFASPGLHDLGAWLEQLLAESTGKDGKGIIPVDRERPGPPEAYGDDRVFAYLRLEEAPSAAQDAAVLALEKAGHPVVRIHVATKYDLAEEFVRWEIATAIAGAILRINPFNQPDVEASKVATKALTSEYEKRGKLPSEAPFFEGEGVKLFADEKNQAALKKAAGSPSLTAYLKAHLDRLGKGDYLGLLAYVHMTAAHEEALQTARHRVRDRKRVATCLGFGPRFLHSTGQAYKGGPNKGVFLQVTCDDAKDLAVPGQEYTFGVVKAAQARGDFQVLAERDRRALRVHLGPDVAAGLKTLNAALEKALS
ncbi:MAG: transaldolase [Acidobacteria bacterium]|nr:MAG: transaldolase [Acidobacteriota bacterium]